MNNNISDSVKYIGVDDTTIDLFESQYVVPEGVSYNSYVILDEKTAVMDTVDKRGMKQWEDNLINALDGRKADYVIVQHMEPDHAGSLARLLELYPDITVVGNAKTFVMINQFFENIDIKNTLTVKEGDTLSLGSHTLTFVMAPMVHWPEVMVTYESSEKILFSADGFGKFGALSLTENEEDWACEARRYYFNIVGKYGAPVQTLLKKASALDIKTICPLHGPVLTDNLGYYLDLYNTWSSYQPENKGVFVAYASIHGNTAHAAEKFADMLRNKGVEKVVVTDLSRCDIAEAVEDAFRYDRMVLAAASYDAGVFPIMQDFLHHLQAKAYQNRTVGLIENGSWAPTAAKTMRNILDTMKNITVVEPVVTIKSVLKKTDIPALDQLADAIK
ncbi:MULTISPECIES: FprA family A-type flavoprotein [Clostridia]|jgi:flavorubredoxin|uniref:FprA family A-type flavoprotein n=1 Tax=Clostridia TaxID=186801 RepID=UPI000E5D715A|nr:FprA family A-type flavoprotein [Eubacterium sp. AF22-9]MED9971778.1 FprA family A-type flavoprotein [Lachnospira sp.]RGS27889.1 FprA family A-type flavoprotein [Eubacterium sp. AF22-9]HAS07204.1 flavodoxin [Eubacterium sp.]HCO34675.1 flavodoxin [Eubacterium sp.]